MFEHDRLFVLFACERALQAQLDLEAAPASLDTCRLSGFAEAGEETAGRAVDVLEVKELDTVPTGSRPP